MIKRKVALYKMSSSHSQTERIDDALKQLKLGGMRGEFDELAKTAIKGRYTPYKFLEQLLEHEIEWQNRDRIERRMQQSRLPKNLRRSLEDFDFSFQPTINPQQIYEFESCRFIENAENIIFLGPEGVGKSHLSAALIEKAIGMGYRAKYFRLEDLIILLKKKSEEYQRQHLTSSLFNTDLFVLDDVGFQKIEEETSDFLFQLIKQRYENGSIIFTSQYRFDEWGSIFGDKKRMNAAFGRINHHGTVVAINGPSYRLRRNKSSVRKA